MGRRRTSPADREFRAEVAKKFRQAMKENELTEADAARRLGITRQAVNQYLWEKTTPQGEILARACATWGLTLKYRGTEFSRGAFVAKQSKAPPEVLQMDLFREPQRFENTHLVVTVQRAQKETLQVTIQMKKASLPVRTRTTKTGT